MEMYRIIFFDVNNVVVCSHIVECLNNRKAHKWAVKTVDTNRQISSYILMSEEEYEQRYGRKGARGEEGAD